MSDQRPIKMRVGAPGDEVREARQGLRRVEMLDQLVQKVALERVQDPSGGSSVMKVTFAEFERIAKDPEFESLAKYMNKLLCYADGTPRAKPIRPLLENEMGMYRGRMVVLTGMPGDTTAGTYVQVTETLGASTSQTSPLVGGKDEP
jgi:hypothetical protein